MNGEIDNNGNETITVPTETRGGTTHNAFKATQTYSYDSLNRIKQATETISGQSGNNWQQTFVFDRYGNRSFDEANTTTLPKNCGTSPNFTVCAADRNIVNPSISTSNNQIIKDQDGDSQNDYDFDLSGNTTKDAEARQFIYDGENKQTEVKDSQNQTIGKYYYDGDGKRVKKYVPSTGETTIFIYDASSKLVAEYSTEVTPQQDAKVSYLTSDHLGSPRINTDQNGAVTARHDYQPFGEEIQRASYGADTVRKQFTSYERDKETDLDYAKARMFGSSFGRFTSPDDFLNDTHVSDPQSWNLYVYVRNNPHRFIDPDGEIKRDCGKNKDEICFDPKEKNVTRKYGDNTITFRGTDGKDHKNTYTFTGIVTTGTIYADDGTPIEADQSEGDLTVTVTDENGKEVYSGGIDGLLPFEKTAFNGQNNVANCHGVTFADAKFWINNDQVGALMKGDGYDVNNPSSTPTKGAVGIFSEDGTLGTVRHSVTVVEPGVRGKTPTLVDSKGGREVRTTTTPANAWTNTDPGRKNHQLKYYTQKVKK